MYFSFDLLDFSPAKYDSFSATVSRKCYGGLVLVHFICTHYWVVVLFYINHCGYDYFIHFIMTLIISWQFYVLVVIMPTSVYLNW